LVPYFGHKLGMSSERDAYLETVDWRLVR